VRTIGAQGLFYRVADPTWKNPLDTSFAAAIGGRWNPVGLGALYLNATRSAALANARRAIFARWGRALEDLRPEALPDLQHVDVSAGGVYLDARSPDGIAELGLPATFPIGVPHPPCQALGAAAAAAGLDGVSPLSAVAPTQGELVVFDRSVTQLITRRERVQYPW